MSKENKLYFVKGIPTEEQKKEAQSLGAKIRDASKYHDGDFIEPCSVVIGDAPDAYKKIEGVKHVEAKAKSAEKGKAKHDASEGLKKELSALGNKADVIAFAKSKYDLELSEDQTRAELEAAVLEADKASSK